MCVLSLTVVSIVSHSIFRSVGARFVRSHALHRHERTGRIENLLHRVSINYATICCVIPKKRRPMEEARGVGSALRMVVCLFVCV